jgi:protein-L-isoaspartate(D-aspartate) O-methyltransferase
MNSLIDGLIQRGWLKTPYIIEAFRAIKREDFLPQVMKHLGELDEALSIGFGQTISQPLVVAFMLEQLQPQKGEKILDIGAGSGWTTALLAYIVSPPPTLSPLPKGKGGDKKGGGRVIAIELIPELVEFGKQNVAKYNFMKKRVVEFVCADGSKGYSKESPIDKILCSASAENLPEEWKKQLKIGGKIVTPINNSIWVFEKIEQNRFKETEHPGFVFVPLIDRSSS